MILSFRSKALEKFWWKGETHRVDSRYVKKIAQILADLDDSAEPEEMDKPAYHFHRLTGEMAGRYSVHVNKNWRLTFGWVETGADAIEVDYEDYH